MQKKEYHIEVAGRTLSATFSDLADQANGSVMIRYGETVVLATAVMSKNAKDAIDYFPLTVDYEEKFYAVGKILGGRFIKREGRPSDEAILAGRIVDRTIRPLFDPSIRNEVQVVITVLSFDEKNDPDVASVIAASLALGTSDIPWAGPVSAVRLGMYQGETTLRVNPELADPDTIHFDLLVCGKDNTINMIEAEGKEITEDFTAQAFKTASSEIEKIQTWQKQIISEIGKVKKVTTKLEPSEALKNLFTSVIAPKLQATLFCGPAKSLVYELQAEWLQQVAEQLPEENKNVALQVFENNVNDLLHSEAIENKHRPDGRDLHELRSIYTEAGGLSSIVHGSGIFYRGGTHILSVLTLSGPKDSQVIEGMEVREKKYFMHHYNFPPFSTGETGRLGGTNRRAIGHGALAEKSLRAVLPARETFPYTIRLVSEALASNGSTSMGSVCGSTLAMMDGGVPIKRPVAGIAMGLMMDQSKYQIITDIQGPEDHYGDMDFKIAGTTEGITGIQLDVKVGGIPIPILVEALTHAKQARLQIIEKIINAIATPRPQVKPSAPLIETLKIPTEKIGAVIGPGGKIIQKITAETGADIEIDDDGTVYITGNHEGVVSAKNTISDITHEYKVGEKFEGVVTRLMDFGVFVKIGRDTEGLVHISEIADFRIEKITDFVTVGEKVPVVIKEIDDKHRINLSIKQVDPDFAKRKKPSTN